MGTTTDKLQAILNSKEAIKSAIENKGVADVGDVLSEYANKISSIQTGNSNWTGHADVEGLRAIGWTDEDIAYYQEHGVNWNEEDDEYHKVPEDNKALYGIINIDNIQDYKDILVYLPKIDTTGETSMSNKFKDCYSLVAIPLLDTSSVTIMDSMFYNCYSLTSVPLLNTSNVTEFSWAFRNCYSLVIIPLLDMSNAKGIDLAFNGCSSLKYIPLFNTSNATNLQNIFGHCYSLVSVPLLDVSNATSMLNMFAVCYSVVFCNLKNLKLSIDISATSLLKKSSLLYMIENAAPSESIIITLSTYCYNKYSEDPDIVAALEKQPLVTLASA